MENKMTFWKNLNTGEVFQNRKEAKKSLGHYEFNRLCKDGVMRFFKTN